MRNALAASQARARVLVSYSDLIADPQGATERLVRKLREAGIEGLTLPKDVNGFVSPALHREAARETDLEALLNPAQMDLWAALKGRGNLVAEGERGVSEGALVLLRDLERQYAARLKTDERLKHQDFQVHELQKEIEEIQVDAARHRAQNESLARQLAETETDLAKAQAEVEIHKTRNEDFSRKLAGQRVELTAAREEVAAYDKRNNNLLKKIKARDSELARFQREAGERSVEIADLRADLELTQQLLNAGLAQLQRKLDNARQQPSKFMRRKILSRVLYFFSRQHLLFSERRRKHFLHSAQKRDPKRDDLERIRSKARRQIAAQAKKRSAARNDKTDKMEARDKDIGFTPSTSSAEAIAASAISPHTASMSRKEAERVFSEVTAHLEPGQRPRRFFPDFDTEAAQRYVAAANAFYDDDCAALKATVIMPTYNRGNQIASAIRSVLDQTHGNLELLVIDDGSTDDTPAQLVRFSDDPRLRVFHENHAGVSVARNTGLAHASGDYVFYLDSDNTWTPDHVKLMLVGLRATGAECAYAASCVVSEAGELLGYRGAPFDWDACLAANYVDMNVMAHSRDLFHQCGGFDTNLRRMVDWDLILRYTKSRTVPFFPFIGCMYLNHGSDKNRITVSQPYLYRRIVSEKNRLGLKSGAEALDSLQLSFAIKIAAPYKKRAQWGDFHYAESLSNALQRLGHSVRIDFGGDWNTPKARKDDVVLVLRGLAGYTPHRSQLTLMWNISHPDRSPTRDMPGATRC